MQVEINDITIDVVIEKKKNKNMYFRFSNPTTLNVTCPYLTPKALILSSIKKNYKALSKMQIKASKNNESDEFFCFKGNRYIRVFDERYKGVSFIDDFVYAKDEVSLEKFIKKYTKEYFQNEIDLIKQDFKDIPEFSLKIRKMKTRWGVCNRRLKTVTLNSELIKRTKEELDYVIVHELCHFYEGNHSKRFWMHVERHFPNYKIIRKQMKEAV